MKQRYTKEDLAKIAKKIINLQYNNPKKILDDLKTNIKGKVRSLHAKELTDNEIATLSLKVASELYNDLDRITIEIISIKLSNEIIDKSYREGIEELEYRDYFIQFAKEMVKQLLQAKFSQVKKQIKQAKCKPKNK